LLAFCILTPSEQVIFMLLRFWYENPSVFKPEQLTQIKQTSLGRVLCDNGDDMTDVTRNVFVLPNKQSPAFVSCSDLTQIDMRFWTECCHGTYDTDC
jgi:peroxidase